MALTKTYKGVTLVNINNDYAIIVDRSSNVISFHDDVETFDVIFDDLKRIVDGGAIEMCPAGIYPSGHILNKLIDIAS